MARILKTAFSICIVGGLALTASAAPTSNVARDADDMLPEGTADEIAGLFHSALEVPDVADWLAEDREDLLDVVTLRYKNRLIDRAPAASLHRVRRYVEQLAHSGLAKEFPNAMRQTCAQYGLTEGSCAQHRGYVRRALVLEEMLARQQLTLGQMEAELAGATRPTLEAWGQEDSAE